MSKYLSFAKSIRERIDEGRTKAARKSIYSTVDYCLLQAEIIVPRLFLILYHRNRSWDCCCY